MNARIPARSTGAWGQVKQHHVLAALCGSVLMVAGVGAAVAWAESDGSSGTSTSGVRASNFDYIEYTSSAAAEPAPNLSGTAAPRDLGARAAEITISEVDTRLADRDALKGARAAEITISEAAAGPLTGDSLKGARAAEISILEVNTGLSDYAFIEANESVQPSEREPRGHVTVD